MRLKLKRPISFFDTESTGVNVGSDRVISLSILKLNPDGSTDGKSTLVKPFDEVRKTVIPIPKEATAVHLITDDMVKDAPTFKQISKGIYKFFEGCDIAGYNNNNFDNAILYEEFLRCGIEYPTPDVKSVDVLNIFKKMESRTLSYAYKFYCGKDLEDAHDSRFDTVACKEIFLAQIEKYPELLDKEVDFYRDFSKVDDRVDFAGKIVRDEKGNLIYNFGKAKGTKISDDTGFAEWMLKQTFITENTKNVVRFELNRLMNK